jgi:hypothetical protein
MNRESDFKSMRENLVLDELQQASGKESKLRKF